MRRFPVLILLFATIAGGQTPKTFPGFLDGKLHIEALSPLMFDAGTADDAKRLDIKLSPGDSLYLGTLGLPKRAVLKFPAAILRLANGTDFLYVDEDREGHLVQVPFGSIQPGEGDPRLKSVASFDVKLPAGPYKTCPMQVYLPAVASPASAPKLPVAYTSLAYVQGTVQLPGHALMMRFEYEFDTMSVDLEHGLEMADLNGDGKIDETPGNPEFMRSRGSAPVFRVDSLTLQVDRVDLQKQTFVVRSAAAASYQRIDLSVGSVLPDFAFTDLHGVKRHLSDVKGKYRLLDFWATWCVPCVQDLPFQRKAYEAFHARGFEILGMNGDDSTDKAVALLQRVGATWPQARKDEELYEKRLQIALWPTLILIDEKGKIVSRGEKDAMPLDGDNLEKTLKGLLGP